MQLSFYSVSFTYRGSGSPLVRDLIVRFPSGWTGIVGANGAGKTTILRLACADLEPQEGHIQKYSEIFCYLTGGPNTKKESQGFIQPASFYLLLNQSLKRFQRSGVL